MKKVAIAVAAIALMVSLGVTAEAGHRRFRHGYVGGSYRTPYYSYPAYRSYRYSSYPAYSYPTYSYYPRYYYRPGVRVNIGHHGFHHHHGGVRVGVGGFNFGFGGHHHHH